MMNLDNVVRDLPSSHLPIVMEMIDLQSIEEVYEYRSKQTKLNQERIDLIMKLIALEASEEILSEMDSYPEAEIILKKIMKNG